MGCAGVLSSIRDLRHILLKAIGERRVIIFVCSEGAWIGGTAVLNAMMLLYLQQCMQYLNYEFTFHFKCVHMTLFAFCSSQMYLNEDNMKPHQEHGEILHLLQCSQLSWAAWGPFVLLLPYFLCFAFCRKYPLARVDRSSGGI